MRIVAAFPSEVDPSLARGGALHVLGPGWCWREAPSLPGTDLLLITGSCGALDASARAGDLVLPAWVEARGERHAPAAWAEALLVERAVELGLELRRGGIVEGPAVVDEPDARAALARAGATHVDGESARLAALAAQARRPWVALRFVTDTPEQPLGWLRDLLGGWPEREPGVGTVAIRLAATPSAIPRLVRLGRLVRASRRSVAALAEALPAAEAAGHGGPGVR